MYEDEGSDVAQRIDWAGACRLALVVSILAAVAAVLLGRLVGETTLVVTVIVAGTAASWFQLENDARQPHPARRD